MKAKKTVLLLLCTSISLLFFMGSAFAMTEGVTFSTLDITFNNPGARAMGMGGAFIGVADDATAAYTNPAGLTILTKPEVAAEYKYTQYKTRGNILGYDENYWYVFHEDTKTNHASGPSFISFAYPTEKATFTLFRHELINLDTNIPTGTTDNINYHNNRFRVTTYGIAAAVKLAKGFSLGANISFSELDLKFMPYPERSAITLFTSSDDNSYHYTDTQTHGTIGLFWNPFGEIQIGAVYRYGPDFRYNFTTTKTDRFMNKPDVTTKFQYEDNLKIPDSYGLGFSYRLFNALTLAADVSYIKYSQIMNDFKPTQVWSGYNLPPASDYKCDDTIDVNAGFEYVFSLSSVPMAVRGGYHYAPSHTAYYNGDEETYIKLVPKGKDEHIFSAGIGAVMGKSLQVDFAGSWSDLRQEYITSLVYRF